MRATASLTLIALALFTSPLGAWPAQAASGSEVETPIPKGVYDRAERTVQLPDRRRMNFRCRGHGSPTVILESGFGAGSQAWGRVQPRIAGVTRVCAYDRAGYGFSDLGPLPRDGAAIARDLDHALRAAAIRGPYIVVGHSAGGLYARLFAARRRSDVAGLVLVDSSTPFQDRRLSAMLGPGAGGVEGIRQRVSRCLEAAKREPPHADTELPTECAPLAAVAHDRLIAGSQGAWRTQLSELDTLFAQTSMEVDRIGNLLQDIPLIVLTASATGTPAGPGRPGPQAWEQLHAELAASSRRGEQRIVLSSHLMMNDRPEIVAGAILELVEASHRRRETAS